MRSRFNGMNLYWKFTVFWPIFSLQRSPLSRPGFWRSDDAPVFWRGDHTPEKTRLQAEEATASGRGSKPMAHNRRPAPSCALYQLPLLHPLLPVSLLSLLHPLVPVPLLLRQPSRWLEGAPPTPPGAHPAPVIRWLAPLAPLPTLL
jgi:hypothetical protein